MTGQRTNFSMGWGLGSLAVSMLVLIARGTALGLEEVSAEAVRRVASSVSIIFIGHFSQTYWLARPRGRPMGERQKYLANDPVPAINIYIYQG
jgi:hypothetical protein